jgi:hypothetical protein
MSTYNIPKSVKREFYKSFSEYLDVTKDTLTVYLNPYTADCPNCIIDNVQKVSSNVYDTNFLRPVYIFPETPFKRKIYPIPFNVTSASGVQYDPSVADPKILTATRCPVCFGDGVLKSPNSHCMKALITWDYRPKGENTQFLDLSAGRESKQIIRIKTYDYNYALCRDALYFILNDGLNSSIKAKIVNPAKLKGLGDRHITELFLVTTAIDSGPEAGYNVDKQAIVTRGEESNQAPILTPTIPPDKPGDDVW